MKKNYLVTVFVSILALYFIGGCASKPEEPVIEEPVIEEPAPEPEPADFDTTGIDAAKESADKAMKDADEQKASRIAADEYNAAQADYSAAMAAAKQQDEQTAIDLYKLAEEKFLEAARIALAARQRALAAMKIMDNSINNVEYTADEAVKIVTEEQKKFENSDDQLIDEDSPVFMQDSSTNMQEVQPGSVDMTSEEADDTMKRQEAMEDMEAETINKKGDE